MKHELKVKWTCSADSGIVTLDLEDIGCTTLEQWQSLTEEEKGKRIQSGLDDFAEQPYMVLGNYSINSKK